MNKIAISIICICFVLSLGLYFGCKEKAEVEVTLSGPKSEETSFSVVRINANLLRNKPENPDDRPSAIRTVKQGDQILRLKTEGDWTRVQHLLSGDIGWLNNTFIQIETRSLYWSGDTDKARRVAERVYKDKIFLQRGWPVMHINVEERWNKLTLTADEQTDFSRSEAIDCCRFALEKLTQNFPSWNDHQVFLTAVDHGETFSVVIGDSGKPLIF
ncbi:hypothetical protein JW979_04770 [bacterium]|nr:hypothetical protein [candidate division CSSED10-310 bacterium]